MDVSINSDVLDELNTVEAKALHKLSDSLSACGVGKIVNLPQIIVVGEQSSGKSSVLEAISHVRFPVEAGVCTRFATELVLRQADKTRVNVTVRFADKAKASQTFQRTGFHENDLPDIIKDAKECMGFTQTGKGFSKDVLRLEIEGPKMYPLRLVDLPGLFHSDTETQSLEGKETVDRLVEGYMRQKNSIILMVITANNQLANHIALRKVKEIDLHRERTIGVITKPDLTRPGYEDERTYVRVARNQEGANKMQLGWHVLRNRAEDETSLEARDEIEEKFFETGAWGSIPREDRGIGNLRKKLSRVLYNHIRQSLPGVVEDIEGQLRERQEELRRLGKSRSSQEDMRSFLLTIAGDFQRLAWDGIYGRYNDAFFGDMDDEARKLRAQLRNFNRAFDHILKTKGSTQVIIADGESEPENDDLPEYLEDFLERYPYEFPDPEIITREELSTQLQRQAAVNQGREFPGSPNGDLAIQLFKKQAVPWKEIAEFHVDRVTTVAKAFVDELFKHVIGPPHTSQTIEAILSTCVDPFFDEKEKVLRDKLKELLRPYSQGYALPLDVEFYRTLSQKSKERLASRFHEIMHEKYPEMFDRDSKKRLTEKMIMEAISSDEELQDGEFGTDKVIDSMLAYYEMSRRTLTDNVVNLAIESCLVCDIPYILTPTQVNRMSKERLEELAAESGDTISRRESLQAEVDVLREGLAQCRRYRPRTVTVLPSSRANVSPTGATNRSATGKSPEDCRLKPAGATTSVSSGLFGNPSIAKPVSSTTSVFGGLFSGSAMPTSSTTSVPSLFSSAIPASSMASASGGFFGGNPSSAKPVSSTISASGGLFGGRAIPASSTTSAPSLFSSAIPASSTASTTGGLFGGGPTSPAPSNSGGLASSSSVLANSPPKYNGFRLNNSTDGSTGIFGQPLPAPETQTAFSSSGSLSAKKEANSGGSGSLSN